ncbi:hypothetical protein NKR19_g3165 [Coniochaeta hoffmannii]|uniref:Uncharacterized protein n=1 Tax=Coniochaeta hoffmannii TaxID=91930 RepID=A0AA38VZ64_9PEZI|nr:hypothetical protein NKR19_g3165 [Coniochaeta hoffmannii]
MATGLERQIPNAAKYDRGSCTDKSWRSSQCPNFCVNAAHGDTLNGGIGIAKCPGPKDMYYCMDGFPFDCTSGDNVLSFAGTPSAITTIGFVASTSIKPSTFFTSRFTNRACTANGLTV